MNTTLWVLGAVVALLALVVATFRDRQRLGNEYCAESAGSWALLFLVAGVRYQIGPDTIALWQFAAGVIAVYVCVLLISRGHPALLTAPYNEDARSKMNPQELRTYERMAWVLMALIVCCVGAGLLTLG